MGLHAPCRARESVVLKRRRTRRGPWALGAGDRALVRRLTAPPVGPVVVRTCTRDAEDVMKLALGTRRIVRKGREQSRVDFVEDS